MNKIKAAFLCIFSIFIFSSISYATPTLIEDGFENGINPGVWSSMGAYTGTTGSTAYSGNSSLFLKGSDWNGGTSGLNYSLSQTVDNLHFEVMVKDLDLIPSSGSLHSAGHLTFSLFSPNSEFIAYAIELAGKNMAVLDTPLTASEVQNNLDSHLNYSDTSFASQTGWHLFSVDYQSGVNASLKVCMDDLEIINNSFGFDPGEVGKIQLYVAGQYHNIGEGYFDDILLTTNSQPVPVPATLLLFGSGLAGLAGIRRKKLTK